MALKITITDAGRAALINANKSGTRAVSIAAVGVSATVITADKLATNLPDEIKRITTISGEVTAADAIHLTAKDDGDSVYTVRSFALYLDDGTLFAIYGQPSPILEKSAAAMLLLQLDIRFVDIDATQIQFGNLDFINPAATEKTAGVARLTALGEAEQSTENIAVSPVELRRFAEKLARKADMLAALATKFDKAETLKASDTQVDLLYANRRFSFQVDGNIVNYGTDAAVLTTLKDGLLWTRGSVSSQNNVNVTGMLHIQSFNGLNGFDIHCDEDGNARMYAKNGNTGYQLLLAYNPQGNLDFLSPSGQAFINSHEICHRGNDGAGSGWDMDLFRGNAPEHFATADDRNNLQNAVNNLSATKVDKVPTFSASNTQVDFLYANRRFSFQVDGNIVNYGTDAAVLTTLKDGLLWTRGSVSSQNNVNVTGMLHIQSFNGLNGFDIHCDEDGNARMYAKNGNTGYQLLLAYNPQGNLDFLSPSGQAFINSHEICHRGNDGAGSGWDMDLFRGNPPEHFATADDRVNLQNQININNSRIETTGVPNGLMKRIDDHVELHLKLDNVVGIITLPHTFNNIVDIQITTFRDTDSRPVWANVISYTNNTITVSGNYMAHGNNQNADSCAGFIHVYGN